MLIRSYKFVIIETRAYDIAHDENMEVQKRELHDENAMSSLILKGI